METTLSEKRNLCDNCRSKAVRRQEFRSEFSERIHGLIEWSLIIVVYGIVLFALDKTLSSVPFLKFLLIFLEKFFCGIAVYAAVELAFLVLEEFWEGFWYIMRWAAIVFVLYIFIMAAIVAWGAWFHQ
jgi:hypothetical protein